MSDPKQKLTTDQVRTAGADDWRQLGDAIRARFATGDFATGLTFVAQIGEAAEAANHHPEITLSYPEVIVTLNSHDVGGVTSRDIDLARQISALAADLGATADRSGLTRLEVALDTANGSKLGPFYAALLGGSAKDDQVVDSSGQTTTLWWQAPEGGNGPELPEPEVEQRWHLDVWVPHDEAEARLQAALDAGGRLISDETAPSFWVLEDPEGNRSCICTSAGR